MSARHVSKTLMTLAGTSHLLLIAACGESNVIEALEPAIELREYNADTIRVRYMDDDGLPIAAASIRFAIRPNATSGKGARLRRDAAITNADGIASVRLEAGEEASFLIEADANETAAPIRLPVGVSRAGRIDVSINQAAAAAVRESEVLLLDGHECCLLDELALPPASHDGINSRQIVPIEGRRTSNVSFRGLQPGKSYTVAALGRAGQHVVAFGCEEGLVVSEGMVEQRRASSVALDLYDFCWPGCRPPRDVALVTTFDSSVGLTRLAALLNTIAAHEAGLAGYLIDHIAALSNSDAGLQKVTSLYRQRLIAALAGDDGPGQVKRLQAAARALASVEDLRLHSRMSIRDEDESLEGAPTQTLNIRHRMHKLSALVTTRTGRKFRRDFPVISLADPNLAGRRRVFDGAPPLKLANGAVMYVDDAGKVSIDRHAMSIPIADALIGQILFEQFGDYSLSRITAQMVGCNVAGTLAGELAEEAGLDGWEPTDNTLLQLLEAAGKGAPPIELSDAFVMICQHELQRVLAEAQRRTEEDLTALRPDQDFLFEGSAELEMLSHGVKITSLRNGIWTSLGTFEATAD